MSATNNAVSVKHVSGTDSEFDLFVNGVFIMRQDNADGSLTAIANALTGAIAQQPSKLPVDSLGRRPTVYMVTTTPRFKRNKQNEYRYRGICVVGVFTERKDAEDLIELGRLPGCDRPHDIMIEDAEIDEERYRLLNRFGTNWTGCFGPTESEMEELDKSRNYRG